MHKIKQSYLSPLFRYVVYNMNWKKIAAKFVKNKKPNETLEMALRKAHAHMQTVKQRGTRRNKTMKRRGR